MSQQIAKDCKVNQCDGNGNMMVAADNQDVPTDGDPCTLDVCSNGVPSNPSTPAGTACNQGGKCNDSGECVQCLTVLDCPGEDGECAHRTCITGTCGMESTAAGTRVAEQTAGDCKVNQCDGQGHVVTTADNSDRPADDGQQCTSSVCNNGVPSHAPVASGTACNQDGGRVCNAGECVECLNVSHCPGQDNGCQSRTCNGGHCGMSYVPAGVRATTQTPGDCKEQQCNGSGGITTVNMDSDVQEDGNACTANQCSSGVASNPPLVEGTPCSQNGGTECNGRGTCVYQPPVLISVVLVGDGAAPLTTAASPVYILTLDLSGAEADLPLALPTTQVGNHAPFTLSGSTISEGSLTASTDGRYLVMAGYAASPGQAQVANTDTSLVPRVVARVDAYGNVDTTTVFTGAFRYENVRSACSVDGRSYWVSGFGSYSSGGMHHVVHGGDETTHVLTTPNNSRWCGIWGGQLFVSSANPDLSGVLKVGTGLPTATNTSASRQMGLDLYSPFGFVLMDRDTTVPGLDTAYVTDEGSTRKGLRKVVFDGISWTAVESFTLHQTVNLRSVAARVRGGRVILVGTTAEATTRIVVMEDDGTIPPTPRVIATAPTNTAFRGIAMALE